MWLAIVFALACGALTALQSRINGQLAHAIDDPFTAAAISFGSGLVILLVVLAAWRPGRQGFGRLARALRERRLAWWMVLGGLAGAWFVITQGLSAGVVGVALFTVAIVAGQTLGGALAQLDSLGFTYQVNGPLAFGQPVTNQSPLPGLVKRGATVTLSL